MTMKISLYISERDLKQFRKAMRGARAAAKDADEAEIVKATREVMDSLHPGVLPDFVRERLPRLQAMCAMLEDEEWNLPAAERLKLLSALIYFGDPEDLIPDQMPGLGYLDDAIMIELVLRELKHVIEAYDDFCEFRDNYFRRFKVGTDAMTRRERVGARRNQLHERMARRMQRDRETAAIPAPLW
jgi:uncharacterized membrane protein YkvA (DUF1232 family)